VTQPLYQTIVYCSPSGVCDAVQIARAGRWGPSVALVLLVWIAASLVTAALIDRRGRVPDE
jgi:hypothetical protein